MKAKIQGIEVEGTPEEIALFKLKLENQSEINKTIKKMFEPAYPTYPSYPPFYKTSGATTSIKPANPNEVRYASTSSYTSKDIQTSN